MSQPRASVPRRRRSALLSLSLGLVAIAFAAVGCESIAGIRDRHFEQAETSDGAAPAPAGCDAYCDAVMTACTETFAQYPSKDACLAVCAELPAGDAKKPTGNTVACRMQQARLAQKSGEANTYCGEAGPGGAGKCGTDCESYCLLFSKSCPEDATDDCVTKCGALIDDSPLDLKKHHDTNDTLQCRLVHVTNAGLDPDTHCPHAALAPQGGPCQAPDPKCDLYCHVVMTACTGDHAQYESLEQCQKVCAAFDVGTSADKTEDTLGCRIYHGYNALALDPTTHCSHAGPGGDGHCGTDNCPSYCHLLAASCPTDFAALGGDTACETACEALPGATKDYHGSVTIALAGGDDVTCRTLFAARAFSDPTACAAAVGAAPCKD